MTGWDVAAALAAVALLLPLALRVIRLWAQRSLDRHVHSAQAVANPVCACDDPRSLRAHSATRCVPRCACRRLLPDTEPWHHGAHGCYPAREVVS